jgi:hypothetical protein
MPLASEFCIVAELQMQRKWLNMTAGSVVVLAIVWQAYVIAQQAFRDKAGPKVNVEKLLTDLRSLDYKTKHAALHSVLALAGADKFRPQLLNAGFNRAVRHLGWKGHATISSWFYLWCCVLAYLEEQATRCPWNQPWLPFLLANVPPAHCSC